MESIGLPVSWEGLGIGSFVFLAVFLIYTGRLVPKNLVERMLKSKDETIEALTHSNSDLISTRAAHLKLLKALTDAAETQAAGSDDEQT